MTRKPLECSIIIRCYNEEKYIGRLLYGIMQQSVKDVEIIIVDSGSNDNTLDVVSQFPVKITSIKPEKFSFGRSLNIGCQMATGDYLVFASAHVYPLYKDWLENLLFPLQNQNTSMVYGRQVGGAGTRFSERQIFAKWFPAHSHLEQNHPFCNNANSALRRCLWQKYAFNENLTGLEDIDWANRLMPEGFRVVYAPTATVAHVHHEKPLQILNRYRREAIAIKKIFPNETFYLWDFCRLYLTNVLMDFYQALHERVFFGNMIDILRFRFMQFWGTYRGFAESGQITEGLRKKLYYPNQNHSNRNSALQKDLRSKLLIDYNTLGTCPHEKNH